MCLCVCLFVCMCVCVSLSLCVYVCACMCVRVRACVCIRVRVCMWVSVRAHHIRTHTWYVLKHPHILYLCSSLLCPWLPSSSREIREITDLGTPTRTLTTSQKWREFQPAAGRSFASARCCMARICTRGAAWRAGRRACGRGGPARSRRCARPSAGRSKHAQHERASSARSSGAIVGRDRRARSSGAIVGRERRCTRVHVCWRA